MRRREFRSNNGGFTLLEVMVALTIVSIALVAMLGLTQRNILINSRLQQMTRATLLAKQKMAEISVNKQATTGLNSGTFPPPNQDYNWRADYVPTPFPGIRQIDLSVIWGDEKQNELVTLTSFLQDLQQ